MKKLVGTSLIKKWDKKKGGNGGKNKKMGKIN